MRYRTYTCQQMAVDTHGCPGITVKGNPTMLLSLTRTPAARLLLLAALVVALAAFAWLASTGFHPAFLAAHPDMTYHGLIKPLMTYHG